MSPAPGGAQSDDVGKLRRVALGEGTRHGQHGSVLPCLESERYLAGAGVEAGLPFSMM